MATYLELYDLRSDSTLRNKVAVAVTKKAQALIAASSPTTAQITWANAALLNPQSKADPLLNYLLAANSASTAGQITSVSDGTIQTAVDAAVDKLIAGGA